MNLHDNDLKASYINLGCRVNRVEIDVIAKQLEDAGFTTTTPEDADVIIVNTCGVTGEAEAKTRKSIRHAANLSQTPLVVATGCVVNLFADEISNLAENVVAKPIKTEVASFVTEYFDVDETAAGAHKEIIEEVGEAITPTGRTRPGIKIQDGCNNRCSYCIVWKARGKATSLPYADVLKQVKDLEREGAREVVLTGINLANYEDDSTGEPMRLAALLDKLMDETSIERFRLSSIEPPETDDELLECIANSNGRIAPFLHLALQSGCDRTLKEMNRNYTVDEYREVVRKARALIPNLALGCDLIVGFPGETDEDFEESLAFCKEMQFEKMHIFRYSERPGTPAAQREDQIDPHTKSERARRVRELALEMRAQGARRLIGTEQDVLIQAPGYGVSGGLFVVKCPENLEVNSYVKLKIDDVKSDRLIVS